LERLAVKSGGRVVLVKTDDIDWIEAADNYVELHAGSESHLLRETLSALEARLAPAKFIRISRSIIVKHRSHQGTRTAFSRRVSGHFIKRGELTLSRGYRNKLPQLGVK